MSGKRNISYVKPQDPSFIAKIKAQIGYQETATVETKRQKLEDLDENSTSSEFEGENPQIVVLQTGDLSSEEVAKEKARIEREVAEAPADLSKPIAFQRRKVNKVHSTGATNTSSSAKNDKANNCGKSKETNNHRSKRYKTEQTIQKSKLSFNIEEEDDASWN